MPYQVFRSVVVNVQVNGVQINRACQVNSAISSDSIGHATDASGVNALPAPSPGSLTTRTNDTEGTITLEAGHDVVTGRVDLYWDGGMRRGVSGTVTGDSLAITGGSGDNLPAQDATIYAVNPRVESVVLTGDDVEAILVSGDANVGYQIVLTDAGDVELADISPGGTGNSYEWVEGNGITNPVAGETVAKLYMSHDDSTADRSVSVLILKS